jgi:hypothetical protein
LAEKDGDVRRVLLAAGTTSYLDAEFAPLTEVPESLHRVVQAASALNITPLTLKRDGYLLDPGTEELKDALSSAAHAGSVVIVYYTGHGAKPDGGPYYLITTDSKPELLVRKGLRSVQVLELLTRWGRDGMSPEQPAALVILDCCFSGNAGVENLASALYGVGNHQRTWLIASASQTSWAQQGVFARAFADALTHPNTGPSQEFLSLDSLVDQVNRAYRGTADQVARYFPPPWGATGIPPFFPNPQHKPGMAGLSVTDQHWLIKLRGAGRHAATGSYLAGSSGRIRAAETLCHFLTHQEDGGVCVITGGPGTGKSTLLALAVQLTDPVRRPELLAGTQPDSMIRCAAALLPVDTPVLPVHARGLNTDQAAQIIAAGLDQHAHTTTELLETLQSGVRPPDPSIMIVVDAVDEAASPRTLIRSLLRPLARDHGVRLTVGTRRHFEGALNAGDPITDLAPDRTIDLNREEFQDPDALRGYIEQLLVAALEPGISTPYQTDDPAAPGRPSVGGASVRKEVASAIADRATTPDGESFLVGWQMARAVRNRNQWIDVNQPGWRAELPADYRAALDEELGRLDD